MNLRYSNRDDGLMDWADIALDIEWHELNRPEQGDPKG